jgi:protein-disulfide isomerase
VTRIVSWLMLLLSLVVLPQTALAEACEALAPAQRKVANEILDSQHAYDCCDGTLTQCLKRKPLCRLVQRLSEDICRRVALNQSRADIERELGRRATSMMPTTKPRSIDTKGLTPVGTPDAKVTALLYVCPRCPFCSTLVPTLAESAKNGKLKGKAKLYARLFPLRSHEGSTEAGIAVMAAQKLGKFWEYLLHLYTDFAHFDPAHLDDVAVAVGIDRDAFLEATKDPATRQTLVDAKKDGVRNQIESTPTLFINGRPYTGDLSEAAVQDVLEEEYERLSGQKYR